MTKAAEKNYIDVVVETGLQGLVQRSGCTSREHGFHEDWPAGPGLSPSDKESAQCDMELRRAIAEKLALIHEEVSEALGEIRSGRDPLEVYFVDKKGLVGTKGLEYTHQQYDENGVPLCKPEGFLVELADVIIRTGDLAYLVTDEDGAHLADATTIKHDYNMTRPYKHGRKL